MPAQDTSQLKEKIISILRIRGPSLPVHIAKETGLSMLFASAFLSELFSERKIKISNMKVGNSPIYFIAEQKHKLENFSHHLKSKEKDAFTLLKEKKFLNDKNQDPAIRVALRAIKDFAIPLKKNDELFWRYFTISETEFQDKEETPQIKKEKELEEKPVEIPEEVKEEISKKEIKVPLEKEETLNIFDKREIKQVTKKRKKSSKKSSKKQNEKLFNKVKDFLSKENIEIIDFQAFNKNEIVLKIKENQNTKLLIAYNKKRITELDLLKTYKKINNKNLPYIVLSFGYPPKKLMNLIDTIKNLEKVEKFEENTQSKTF